MQDLSLSSTSLSFRSSIKCIAIDPLQTRSFHPQARMYIRFQALDLLVTLLQNFGGLEKVIIMYPKSSVDLSFSETLTARLQRIWDGEGIGGSDGVEETRLERRRVGFKIQNVMYGVESSHVGMREALESLEVSCKNNLNSRHKA
jgi:hypothetical protein